MESMVEKALAKIAGIEEAEKQATPGTLRGFGGYLSVRKDISGSIYHLDELGQQGSGPYQAVPFSRFEDAQLLAELRNAAPATYALLSALLKERDALAGGAPDSYMAARIASTDAALCAFVGVGE